MSYNNPGYADKSSRPSHKILFTLPELRDLSILLALAILGGATFRTSVAMAEVANVTETQSLPSKDAATATSPEPKDKLPATQVRSSDQLSKSKSKEIDEFLVQMKQTSAIVQESQKKYGQTTKATDETVKEIRKLSQVKNVEVVGKGATLVVTFRNGLLMDFDLKKSYTETKSNVDTKSNVEDLE